ncbi:MAG: FkbM family methyltransferase [Magnetococcales bacterium]|nr:FkbM family methyltransferase [Magnetococcales bacterium]
MLPSVNLIRCKEASYLLFATHDIISRNLYITGQWEEYLLTISRTFVQGIDSPLILDIGANLGAYSIPLAKSLYDVGGRVIGFEPQRIVYYQLCGNIILNGLDNYVALNQAVGHMNGELEIPDINYAESDNIGGFSLDKGVRELLDLEKYSRPSKSTVSMITLDSLVLDKSPSLIKIDVEGYELNVLKGATDFLARHNYPPIIFETWSAPWFAAGRQELLNYIGQLGYAITVNIGDEYVAQHPGNPVRVEFLQQDNGMVNIVRTR